MTGPADGRVVAPTVLTPLLLARCVVHASLIQSEREIFFFVQDLSIASVRLSSIETEYRTIQIHLVVHFIRIAIGLCTREGRSGCFIWKLSGKKDVGDYFMQGC